MTVLRCSGCGTGLAPDQRYCVRCGQRHGEAFDAVTSAVSALAPPVGVPRRRRLPSSALWGGAALLAAVCAGTALGPVVTGGAPAASRAREIVVGGSASGAPATARLTDPPTPAIAALQAPSGNAAATGGGAADSGGSSAPASAGAPADTGVAALPAADAPTIPAPAGKSSPPPSDTATPNAPSDIALSGTVAHVNPEAHGYVLATSQGQLVAVHASKDAAPELAQTVKVKVEQLANGTFRQTTVPKPAGQPSDLVLQGTVTFVAPDARAYTLSARGASLIVHVPPEGALPALRDQPTVQAKLVPVTASSGASTWELDQTGIQAGGQASGAVDHEASVQAIDATAGTLTLSADDTRESGRDIVVSVPAAVDVSKLEKDDVIDATLEIGPDGGYTLTGFSHDENAKAADDISGAQGDQKREK